MDCYPVAVAVAVLFLLFFYFLAHSLFQLHFVLYHFCLCKWCEVESPAVKIKIVLKQQAERIKAAENAGEMLREKPAWKKRNPNER